MDELEGLLDAYWNLAFDEGKRNRSNGTKANEVLHKIREAWNRQASPASAPEGWKPVPVVPTHAILDVMFDAGIDRHDGDLTLLYRAILAASPTPPVSECVDPVMTKEELIAAAESIGMRFTGASIPPVSVYRWLPIETAPKDDTKFLAWRKYSTIPLIVRNNAEYDQYEDADGLFVYGLTHWMPLPKAPAMQDGKP